MYQSAYLVINLLLAVVWLTLFFLRKDLRKEQIFLSIVVGIFAPFTDYFIFFKDYWRPEYIISVNINGVILGIESILCGGLIGGISGVLYESFFRRKQKFSKPRNLEAVIVFVSILLGMFLLNKMGVNSIWASSISLAVSAIAMSYIDKDLKRDALWSSILLLITAFGVYLAWFSIYPDILNKFWLTQNMSGIKLWRIPLEELVWFMSAGAAGGVFYEFWKNVRRYPLKTR